MQQQEEQLVQPVKHAKQVLPPEAYQLAESHRLGKPTAYYTAEKGMSKTAALAFALAGGLFVVSLLIVRIGFFSGNIVVAIMLLIVLLPPLLWPAYLCSKQGFNAINAASAHAYFCQHGLIYRDHTQQVILRWEEIEHADIQYHFWIRRCRVMQVNGATRTLINSVGGSLSGQIRRRLLRSRKKHQHPEISHHLGDQG